MKILLINGSPHEKGTTYTALSEIRTEAEKAGAKCEIFNVALKPIAGCTGCAKCRETGKCVFNDETMDMLVKKMTEADGVIVGTPVYYASPNSTLMSVLTRVFYSGGSAFAGKPAAAVACCRRGGASAALEPLQKFFNAVSMPIVSSTYWDMVYGANGSDAKADLEGMQTMRNLARNMVWMISCINKAAIPFPEQEKVSRTNFIR